MLSNLDFNDNELHPNHIIDFKQNGNQYFITTENGVVLKLEIIKNVIIRFRYAIKGTFQNDFSYAIDPVYKKEIKSYHFFDLNEHYEINTGQLKIQIEKSNAKIKILDQNDNIINEDGKGFYWIENDKEEPRIKLGKKTQEAESFFGLGDKPTDLNIYGKTFQNWGTDTYGYEENMDPIYRNIPFYYGLHHGEGYGIFFDNSYKTHFDFSKSNPLATEFYADGGEMNYYFIYGPQLLDVCQEYTLLTGTPEMPPLWALGYQQCKWSYYPESQVKEIASKMREHDIPCDAIYLDIDYMDGFRCFTWDNEKFPHPKKMIQDLKDDGFKTVVIIDPGIKVDKNYSVFKSGIKNDVFCKTKQGEYFEGKVWPDECYFPDFTNPEVRVWWGELYKELIEDLNVDGVWNDMNEPALFEVESKTFPLDIQHDYDHNPCDHRKAHNVYGMQMARATFEGVKKINPNKRPLIITRSGYSGLQRYSSVWTGDNLATWRHLHIANVQCQRLSISGVSFCGSDIGGFVYHPTPELFYRWIQLGVFHPFFRTHSSGDHGEQEPWSFGKEALELTKKAIELRYQLLPNIYTAFYQYHSKGIPMLKPISFVEQKNIENTKRNNEFLLGNHILISPVLQAKIQGQIVYLPEGNWYNYFSNDLLKGGEDHWVEIVKEHIPIYIKEGSVIPIFPVMNYVGEKEIEIVDLNIYYKNGITKSEFYFDEGEGYNYENEIYFYSEFELNSLNDELVLIQRIDGKLIPKFKYRINLIGFPNPKRKNNYLISNDFKEIKL